MNFYGLIGTYIHGRYRRHVSFPETAAGTPLPPADPQRQYLLYLHIPYCVVLCPFCSFHRVRYEPGEAARYFQCLRREIELVTSAGYRFDELYIGGGTPTVMPDELISTLERLRELHSIAGVSIETNPDDLAKDKVAALAAVGVNRLSVGVQSFDDALLKEMKRFGKYGSGAQIRDRLRRVDGAFDTLNVDMIFNLPHQSEASLQRDLDILIEELGVDQVSYYPLMAAESTKRNMLRSMGRVDSSRERGLYRIIVDRMRRGGYTRTSAWCFSRKAGMFDEYIVDRDEYVGLGSGSFSYLRGDLYASTFSINHYLRLVESGQSGTTRRHRLGGRARMGYYLLMRLFSGSMDKLAVERRFDGRFRLDLWATLIALRAIGAVRDTGDRFELTERGYYLWVIMMREFLIAVNSLRDDMRHHIADERTALRALYPR